MKVTCDPGGDGVDVTEERKGRGDGGSLDRKEEMQGAKNVEKGDDVFVGVGDTRRWRKSAF